MPHNEIFVFGSNLAGKHYSGAAYAAVKQHGAELGIGEGPSGQSYAFPTLDENFSQRSRSELEASRDKFYAYARENPTFKFRMTPVGTGIAGYSHEEMKSLFVNPPANIILPQEWL